MNLNFKSNKYRPKLREDIIDAAYLDDDELAPVMPAIDAVQQLMEDEDQFKTKLKNKMSNSTQGTNVNKIGEPIAGTSKQLTNKASHTHSTGPIIAQTTSNSIKKPIQQSDHRRFTPSQRTNKSVRDTPKSSSVHKGDECKDDSFGPANLSEMNENEESFLVRNNPLDNFPIPLNEHQRQDEYEFIPKSVILDIYSNDPEVKRFLKQLPRIPLESGLNEQDYKCYSCRRPIGLVFGQPRLCHFDGHHYCLECHLGEKSVIPARILCNWDFNKFPISKRNQHFLTLIFNESMFELKKIAPLLYKMCPELREIEDLRRQAFFVRSYCTTCVQDSISFELTKLVWPREHLIKQADIYSLDDLVQMKNGNLKQVLKNVITFGRQHVLSCVLCCQKGFICELCKSSQIIYPFDIESVHRCSECQSIYHRSCFNSKLDDDACPRCQRLKARRHDA